MSADILSTYGAAKICNVHHTTVINWVNEGKLKAYTTPGGHRRIKKEDLFEFLKKYHMPVPDEAVRKTKSVLIVDDDEEFLEEIKDAFSGQGFELRFASDGFEVGASVYEDKPDLILLDFLLPGLNGFRVCEILHRDEATSNIPIIAMTVLNSEKDIEKIKSCGVREYVSKPVDIEKLLKTVKRFLGIEKKRGA